MATTRDRPWTRHSTNLEAISPSVWNDLAAFESWLESEGGETIGHLIRDNTSTAGVELYVLMCRLFDGEPAHREHTSAVQQMQLDWPKEELVGAIERAIKFERRVWELEAENVELRKERTTTT